MSDTDETYEPRIPDEPDVPVNDPEYDENGEVVANPTDPTEEPYEGDPDNLVPPEEDESLLNLLNP